MKINKINNINNIYQLPPRFKPKGTLVTKADNNTASKRDKIEKSKALRAILEAKPDYGTGVIKLNVLNEHVEGIARDFARPNVVTYNLVVNAHDFKLKMLELRGVNPRYVNKRSSNRIRNATLKMLRNNPESFSLSNLGLKIFATNLINNDDGTIDIVFGDKELTGIADGGHTLEAIITVMQEMCYDEHGNFDSHSYDNWNPVIDIRVTVGIDDIDEITTICGHLNGSNKVEDDSLLAQAKYFDRLFENTDKEMWGPQVCKKQNDEGAITKQTLLLFASALDCSQYDARVHPHTFQYDTKNDDCAVKRLVSAHAVGFAPTIDDNGRIEYNNNFPILFDRIGDIMRLSDILYDEIISNYRVSLSKIVGKDGKRILDKKSILQYLRGQHGEQFEIQAEYWKSWAHILLSAFRANVVWQPQHDRFYWKIDPEKLIDHTYMKKEEKSNKLVEVSMMAELIKIIKERHRVGGNKPNDLLRDETAYSLTYNEVKNCVDEMISNDPNVENPEPPVPPTP